MKKNMLFFLLSISFFQTKYAMDQTPEKQPEIPNLKQIPVNKLHRYIGKSVIYKELESGTSCKHVILGKQIPGTHHYMGYLSPDKTQGIYCYEQKLYKTSKKVQQAQDKKKETS